MPVRKCRRRLCSTVFAPPDEVTAEPDNTKMVLSFPVLSIVMFFTYNYYLIQ